MEDRVPTVSRPPRAAESMHGSPVVGRRRRPSKEDLLPKKSGEVRLRIASLTAGSKEPSFNSRSRRKILKNWDAPPFVDDAYMIVSSGKDEMKSIVAQPWR